MIPRSIKSDSDRDLLQSDLASLFQWSGSWQLLFNADKCSVIHFGKKNPCYDYKVADNSNLGVTTEEKDLGILIDDKLTFKQHIESTVNKANQILGVIKRNFNHANSNAKLQLYKSLVRSKLEYGNCVWCPRLQGDKDKIERVQRRATKFIVKGDLCYLERLKKLRLPTLEYRRLRGDLIETYKIHHNLEKVDNLFIPHQGKTRGHSFKLEKTRTNTNTRATFFSNRIISAWNSLPEAAVAAESTNSFKNKIDRHYGESVYRYKDW